MAAKSELNQYLVNALYLPCCEALKTSLFDSTFPNGPSGHFQVSESRTLSLGDQFLQPVTESWIKYLSAAALEVQTIYRQPLWWWTITFSLHKVVRSKRGNRKLCCKEGCLWEHSHGIQLVYFVEKQKDCRLLGKREKECSRALLSGSPRLLKYWRVAKLSLQVQLPRLLIVLSSVVDIKRHGQMDMPKHSCFKVIKVIGKAHY